MWDLLVLEKHPGYEIEIIYHNVVPVISISSNTING